ncbi:ABC transporter ATP-binding protein [Polaromonas sp.]|nr:ABC transporter ATP-binding protein [Candidatus Saccharibacteria bacterium]
MKNKSTTDNSSHINKQTLRHFAVVWWSYRTPAILSLLIGVQAFFNSTLVSFWIGKILASLGQSGEEPLQYLPYLVVTMVLGVICNYIGFKALFILQPKAMAFLETEALTALLNRSIGFHNNSVAGKLVSDGTLYPSTFAQLSNAFFITLLQFAVTILSGIIIISFHSILLGLLVIAMTFSVLGVVYYQTVRATPLREERHAARRAMTSNLADTITNAVTVKTFAQEARELTSHQSLAQPLMRFRTRDWTRMAGEGSRRIAVLMAFQAAFIFLIIHLVAKNPGLLAIGIFTFSYALSLASRLFDIGNIVRGVEDALLDASDMTRLINLKPEILDVSDAKHLKVSEGTVSFNGVTFKYQDSTSTDSVFSNLELQVQPGEKIGLVGPSGGGKSTLTRLLLRFEDIQSGAITIDGQDIATVSQSSLRESISYVPQEPLLFHRTVKENIAYGKPDASESEIHTAARQANAYEFIKTLPAGFDTIVGERGVKLSGGQRQRVAIARAVLKNAPIIVLDEATSALDSESEVLIQDALWKLMAGRTAIVIAHRLSTIQKMDRIVVLDNGQIVEQGSHKELLKHGGTYAKLWAHQSGGFIED